jgi:hypothetical protein
MLHWANPDVSGCTDANEAAKEAVRMVVADVLADRRSQKPYPIATKFIQRSAK